MKRVNRKFLLGRPLKCYLVVVLFVVFVILIYQSCVPKIPKRKTTVRVHPTSSSPSSTKFEDPIVPFEKEIIVHIDLQGAPLKLSYYDYFFKLISSLGATGVLMAYEDMFPYGGSLRNISALNAYSLEDVKHINMLAKKYNLEIIPLVQTFGHLEFLLKLKEFKDLREVPDYPSDICPSSHRAFSTVKEMITQVLEAHPNSTKVHIGSEEVYYIGLCDKCANAISKRNLSKYMFFLEYVNRIASFIKNVYPNLSILMWDDVFRYADYNEMGRINISIHPVLRKYDDVFQYLEERLWVKYSALFKNVWAASAFKGTGLGDQYLSDPMYHFENHRSWVKILKTYNKINFRGFIITGSQRDDHFSVLKELLPVALPSLVMNLLLLKGYTQSPLGPPTEVAKILNCSQPYGLIGAAFGSPGCSYLGSSILESVIDFYHLKQEFERILEDSRTKKWLNEYNIVYGFSNPLHLSAITSPLGRIRAELSSLRNSITLGMQEIYDNYTTEEWKMSYIDPFEKQVDKYWKAKERILSRESWPRRPLTDKNWKNEL